ncbi:MAG: radical SAM protein, partial [Acidimicrobiales bacterium]|nr:radical SAM protein [Acidimicrobiales bacterium]
MNVLLVSTYELGHQPLHVASPAAALTSHGHVVRCLDLSVQQWDPVALDGIDAVGISVPMHTAMRLGIEVAGVIRSLHPRMPICLYGLYAGTSHETVLATVADRVISGEYEPPLVAWFDSLDGRRSNDVGHRGGDGREVGVGEVVSGTDPRIVHLQRGRFEVPARHLLPPLERYARLSAGGEERLVGYVEASHGCGFNCRHCPVPTVYGGRIRIVGIDTLLADIDQLVAAGATHITFGDPDFLNGVHHSRRVVAAMHERHPELTFDCTTKVELILRHRDIWPELAAAGCLFVVSAFETVNDDILRTLDKGHTRADMVEAVDVLRSFGIEVRPSLLPFTPWTTVDDLVDLVDFVAEHSLVGNVDPVHYSIRLLVPEDSLLIDEPAMAPYLGDYVPERLSYDWTPSDQRTDELQRELARIVE